MAVNDSLIETVEDIPGNVSVANNAVTLPRKAPAQRIHPVGAEHGCVTERESLAMVDEGFFRLCSRQERRLGIIDILEIPPPEEALFAIRRHVIIHSGNERVVVIQNRGAEAKTGIVQTVAHGAVVGIELASTEGLVKVSGAAVENRRIDPRLRRVDALACPWIESLDVGARKRLDLRRLGGIVVGVVVIPQVPRAQRRRRDSPHLALLFASSCAFIIEKEESAVLAQGSSEGRAKNISQQFVGLVWLSPAQFCGLHEIVVSTGNRVAVRFVERSMKRIGAALGNERNLGARTSALVGVVIAGGDAKLLHRILG